MREYFRPPCGSRHVVGNVRGKVVSRVEIAAPVFLLYAVKAEIRNIPAIFSHLVERMRPGIGKLRGNSMPRPDPEYRLQGIVVRRAYAVQLQSGPYVRVLRRQRNGPVRQRLIKV